MKLGGKVSQVLGLASGEKPLPRQADTGGAI